MTEQKTLNVPNELLEEWDILTQGTIDIIPREEFLDKLIDSKKTGKPLRIKFGADPTSPDIHIGHTVPIRKLRQFQDCGHHIVFIIGDFTAQVGDPSGRSETRPQLTPAEVQRNARTYLDQIFKVLDREKTEVVYNSQWLSPMDLEAVLRLTSQYTVARMLERDDFQKRYSEQVPISIHEFLYPLLQGQDSVDIQSDVEVGGTDQTFNLLVGRELQRQAGQKPQCVMTMPLLVGLDGVKKMSKSYDNYIGISEAPREMFGKSMSMADHLMPEYFLLALGYQAREVEALKSQLESGEIHPRDLKDRLGREIVATYYDQKAADDAAEEFLRVFREKDLPDEVSSSEFAAGEIAPLAKLIVDLGMAASKREAKSLIQQGAVKIDNDTQNDPAFVIDAGEYILKVGKRKFHKIVVK